VNVDGEHTHYNKNIEQQVKDVYKKSVVSAAILPTVAPRSIFDAIAVNLESNLPGSAGFIPNRNTFSQAVNRARRILKGHPSKPKSFDDLKDLPEAFTR